MKLMKCEDALRSFAYSHDDTGVRRTTTTRVTDRREAVRRPEHRPMAQVLSLRVFYLP